MAKHEAPANKATLDGWVKAYKDLKEAVLPEYQSDPEYLKIAAEAQTVMERMSLALTLPKGTDQFQKGAERLRELYEKACAFRLGKVPGNIRKALGIPPGVPIDQFLGSRLDAAEKNLPQKYRSLVAKFRKVIMDISVNPADILAGGARSALYFKNGEPNIAAEQAYLKIAEEVAALGNVSPELAALGSALGAGLKQLESVNPMLTASHARVSAYLDRNKMDTRPIKIVVAAGATLIAGLGITQNLFQLFEGKEVTISPITPIWAGIAFAASPRGKALFGSQWSAALEQLKALNTTEVMNASLNFKGKDGKKALEGFTSLNKGKTGSELRTLLRQSALPSTAQIGVLFGPTTPLGKILLDIKDEKKRMDTIKLLARLNAPQIEVLGKIAEMS